MGRPAARLGDAVAHLKPSKLTGGKGRQNVLIGGKPAWRGNYDTHLCTVSSPLHGLGTVINGSSTVLINGYPACRQGDTIKEECGPPNQIISGCPTVLIGG